MLSAITIATNGWAVIQVVQHAKKMKADYASEYVHQRQKYHCKHPFNSMQIIPETPNTLTVNHYEG